MIKQPSRKNPKEKTAQIKTSQRKNTSKMNNLQRKRPKPKAPKYKPAQKIAHLKDKTVFRLEKPKISSLRQGDYNYAASISTTLKIVY